MVTNAPPSRAAIRAHILRTVAALHEPGTVIELRIPGVRKHPKQKPYTIAGYYIDREKLVDEALTWDGKAPAVNITLNVVDQRLYARSPDEAKAYPEHTTGDTDILCRRWLFLDFDPTRPAGVSSTNEEYATAKRAAARAREWLMSVFGWPAPVEASSDNGIHLQWRINLLNDPPNEAASRELVQHCLEAVALFANDDAVTVDTSTSNAARLVKFYGTLAAKGGATDDRPQRRSRLLTVPNPIQVVTAEQLSVLAALAPRPTAGASSAGSSSHTLDLERWIDQHRDRLGEVSGPYPWNGTGRKWRLECCPFNSEHDDGRAYIAQLPSGAISAGCLHASCRGGNRWHDLRDAVEPGWRQQRERAERDQQNGHQSSKARQGQAGRRSDSHESEDPDIPIADGVVVDRDVEPFPVGALPRVMRDLVTAGAAAIHCSLELVALPALGAAGATIGLSRVLRVKGGRTEPALLWGNCVAGVSQGKSPAQKLALAPVYALQRELRAQWKQQLEEYRRTPAEERDGPPPALVQTYTTNSTLEALGNVLVASPRGILFCPDEVTAWSLAMNQYKGGHGSDRQYWLSMHSLTPVLVNRVTRSEPVYIEQPFVAVVGGLQPDVLEDLMPDGPREDGFLARILFAYPPMLAARVSHAEPDVAVVRAWEMLVKALHTLDPESTGQDGIWTPQEVGWGEGGRQAWMAWCAQHDAERGAPDFPARLLGPWGKMDTHCARLALIIHLVRLVSDETHDPGVDNASMDSAARLIRYFKAHARRVYAQLGGSAVERQLLDAVAYLQRQPGRRAKVRLLYHGALKGVRTPQQARDLVARLGALGWARVAVDHGQGGASEAVELV